MAVVLTPGNIFPAGTSVGAYPVARRGMYGAPTGSAAASETAVVAADSTLTYSALPEGDWVAYALVAGEHRYVGFSTVEEEILVGPQGPAGPQGVAGPQGTPGVDGVDGDSGAALTAHLGDTSDAHDASAISVVPAGSIAASNVQAALEEVASEAGGSTPDADATTKGKLQLAGHLGGTAASPTVPGLAAKQDAASVAADSGVTAHLADATDAHDASAVSFAPVGSVAATDVQAAIAEVASEGGAGGMTLVGVKSIPGEETRTNTAYGTMTTADQVAGVVMPTDGLIVVAYHALVETTVGNTLRAAIFLGSNQLVLSDGNGAPGVQETTTNTSAGVYGTVSSFGLGLYAGGASVDETVATTGQVVGNGTNAGPCYIFAAAGTYTVSVQFKSSSGDVAAKNRKLWVWTMEFPAA